MTTRHKQTAPSLRFKGFGGAWEKKTLGEIVEIIGGGTPDTTNPAYWNGDIDWYSPTEIGEHIYANGSVKKITSQGLQKSSAKMLPENKTVLFTSRASIGDMAILTKAGSTNQGFQSFVVGKELDIYFLYSMGFKIKEYALKNASGSTFLEVSKNKLLKAELFIPQLPEQAQLGNFFRELDHRITQSRALWEKSRQLKKAMLTKMFPAVGETTPKIRFKGFTGEWERKTLGEIAFSYSGGTPSIGNNKFYGGNIPFIRSGEIHSSKTELFLTQIGLENSSAKLVKKGDILYALYGATSGEVGRSQMDGAINQAILAIIPSENYDAEFISQWLKANKENIVNLYLQGGQGNLSGEIVKKIEISFPSPEEQTAIGNFFRQLDNTIALYALETEKLGRLKKALLAAMLV
ncbi:restriction endonuclease subunit S [Neisseria canis]|uniref:Type I restriction enzyme n=1 Tax=Neisseria canis TaxID=493 RepID=A0A448D6F8_9NEIS|nr:restriction endonuclease subunit S [Neisseria canis]OSI12758.1 hypothetical protein BWD07_03705 [Neisseria canis]VEE99976.1 type I restriction enzyme [Neisseria canis]